MEAPTIAPDVLLMPAAGMPVPGASTGPRATDPTAPGRAGREPEATQGAADFRSTINALQDSPQAATPAGDVAVANGAASKRVTEPAAAAAPIATLAAIVAPVTAESPAAPISPDLMPVDGSELPATGNRLPATAPTAVPETAPDAQALAAAGLPPLQAPAAGELSADSEPAVAGASTPVPLPPAGRPASAEPVAGGARPAADMIRPPILAGDNSLAGDADHAGLQGGDSQSRSAETPALTVRDLLAQSATGQSLRISLPAVDTGGAQPLPPPALPGHGAPATNFSATLAALPAGDAPPLQPLNPDNFAQGLGDRLLLMSDQGVQSARLKLHPEHLGPLDIRIRVEDDTARVFFHAQHGHTREALEQALPRLREMFAEQGLQLARSEVSSGNGQSGGQSYGLPETGAGTGWPAGEDDGAAPVVRELARTGTGSHRLLDVMA